MNSIDGLASFTDRLEEGHCPDSVTPRVESRAGTQMAQRPFIK